MPSTYPFLAASIGIVLVVLLAFALRRGARRAGRQREHMEDALKYLLDRQWEGKPATPALLAANLHLNQHTTILLIAGLKAQGLLGEDHDLALTSEGERWALHVMRAHRLWERYLADEARMPITQVHREAHRREHGMTAREVDELDAALGHPRKDPHGDPIPDEAGKVTYSCGTPVPAWPAGRPGQVVHLEDEPPLAYAQILAEGIHVGQRLRIVEATPERLVLSDGENEYRLAPALAANIYLDPPDPPKPAEQTLSLADLPANTLAEVVSLKDECQGFTRRRFLDLGLTPGSRVQLELCNAFGDPRAYRVRGTLIALRREQASQILVRPAV